MAHESFEDPQTAQLINNITIPIKVDREERPDVDAVYMQATTAMSGHGGWPMTVFATPDGKPFFAGTYFPKDRFQTVLTAVQQAWRDRRQEVDRQAAELTKALTTITSSASLIEVDNHDEPPIDAHTLDLAARQLHQEFDPIHGGFGNAPHYAPKFPPAMSLEFLLRHYRRTGDKASLDIVKRTADAMTSGGMYDQLAGGFARYSVDREWLIPHFEKMLYDNAQLLRVYTNLWRTTNEPEAKRIAGETAAFILAELRTPEGGFASALDADTESVEGATYAWTKAQLIETLGKADGRDAAEIFQVTDEGTFEAGTSVLRRPPGNPTEIKQRLLAARLTRPQPARDDKVITSWNALAITALAEHSAITDDESTLDAAVQAGELLARVHHRDGKLHRISRDGVASAAPALLEDYAAFAQAAATLHQVTGEGHWLDLAGDLLNTALKSFDEFHDTANDAPKLFVRPKDPTDNVTPAGVTALAEALLSYAALTGSSKHREAAHRALASTRALLPKNARFAGWACAVAEAFLAGPHEIAIVGTGPQAEALKQAAWHANAPGAVIVAGVPNKSGTPLLADRPLINGVPAAYVCRHFVCDAPVVDPAVLAQSLDTRPG